MFVEFYQNNNGPWAGWRAVQFKRERIGVCEPTVFVPEEPVPFEPVLGPIFEHIELSIDLELPDPDALYRITPYAVTVDGDRVVIDPICADDQRPFRLASCTEAPLMRGVVGPAPGGSGTSYVATLETCDNACWDAGPEGFDGNQFKRLAALAGVEPGSLLGKRVQIYGRRTLCVLLGGPRWEFDRVEILGGKLCDPVSSSSLSFGTLRARFSN